MFNIDTDISKEEYASPDALWRKIQQAAQYDALVATVLDMSHLGSLSREHIALALANILIDDRKHLLELLIEHHNQNPKPFTVKLSDIERHS